MRRLAFILMLLACAISYKSNAAETTTQPAADAGDARMEQSFKDLSDPDPQKRDLARQNLMELTASRLDDLRALAERNRPLPPGQQAALREIVMHVYLAGEMPRGNTGFLGVQFATLDLRQGDDAPGALVADRIPGCVAYRMLRNGDRIIGIAEKPEIRFQQFTDLSETIRVMKPGDKITLLVRRQGQDIAVPLRLDARPVWADGNPQDTQNQLLEAAEDYWDTHFSSLFTPAQN